MWCGSFIIICFCHNVDSLLLFMCQGMVIDKNLLDDISTQAKASPRLRMNYDLRNTPDDNSQRMLNAIEPGTTIPIHRHRKTSETVVCLRGRVVEEFFDKSEHTCTDAIVLTPTGPNVAVNVPIGQWHRLRSLESGSVVLSVKDGKWKPLEEGDVLC